MAQVITESLLLKLLSLAKGERLKSSECKGVLFKDLQREGLLVSVPNGRGFYLFSPHEKAFRHFLACRDDALVDLETSLELFRQGGNGSRASQAVLTGNSKLVKTRSCKGFLVNSIEPVECTLNGKKFVVAPPEGSFIFVADYETFVLPENVIVVGIENMENFHFVNRQRTLFKEISHDSPLLFVSRYPQSGDLVKWLKRIPNCYVHFGDLDLAGVHIYLTEFFAHLGNRACFLIPSDVEQRIANGSLERYDDQAERFEKMSVTDERVLPLVKLIKKYHRGYDQEGFIV